MVKVKALQKFTLEKFNELKNIQRFNPNRAKEGELYTNDIFECNSDMVDYLLGNNPLNLKVVDIIEVIPEEKIKEEVEPKKEVKKTTKKKKQGKTNDRKN